MATVQESFKVYLRPEAAEKLREIARTEERPIAGLIRLAVDAFLDDRETKAAA